MSVLMLLEWREIPFATYERVNEIMGGDAGADAPAGLVDHVACDSGHGMLIADVWESQDLLDRFLETRLAPALNRANVPDGQPRMLQVHNRLVGRSHEPNVLVLLDIADFDADAYDEMINQMDALARGAHPAVAHTAALREDGGIVVADLWDSAASFRAFAHDQIAPAAATVGLAVFEPRMLPVKHRILGKVAQATG
jgi:hypothetical protein